MIEFFYGSERARDIVISEYELSSRLGFRADMTSPDIKQRIESVLSVAEPKYVGARVKLKYTEGGVDFGFGEIVSSALLKNLKGAQEAFVFAVTLGIKVDRLIATLAKASPGGAFIADAVASAAAEAFCNLAQARITSGTEIRPRFSPGYGDFPLIHQPALINFLDAGKRIGIYVCEGLLMVPQKSITAVAGIIQDGEEYPKRIETQFERNG